MRTKQYMTECEFYYLAICKGYLKRLSQVFTPVTQSW